jgi:hypothetical protein
MRPASATGEAPSPAPIANAEEAELVVKHLTDVMDALLAGVEEETALVRAGKLGQAARLEPTKEELSRLYAMDTARLKASHSFLSRTVPDLIASLRKRHDNFHAALQMNMTVLATAHAVSESIMRGVSDELARKATPQGYGSSGRTVAPGASGLQPLTLSRVL